MFTTKGAWLCFLFVVVSCTPHVAARYVPFDTSAVEEEGPATLTIPLMRQEKVKAHALVRDRLSSMDSTLDTEESALALLQNVKSMQYVGQLYFGKSQHRFDCIYDTGSSNTWAYTNLCDTEACKRHSRFDTKESKMLDKTIGIEYGSGSIEGALMEDTISFEQCPQECTAAPACHCATGADWIGVTHTDGEAFVYGEFNCILGLAHPKLAIEDTRMTIQAIAQQGRISQRMFGFFLTKTEDLHGSRFTIGQPNKELYNGQLIYHTLFHPDDSRPSYWTVKLLDIVLKYGDNKTTTTGACSAASPCQMALDTGTSLITGPSTNVMTMIDQIDVEEDCSNFDSLPRVGLVFDNPTVTYWMNPSSYVYREKGDDGQSDVCVGAFYPLDVPKKTKLWIAGDTFLSSYYSVYDFGCWDKGGDCRVGLASKSTSTLNGQSAANLALSKQPGSAPQFETKASHPTLSHEVGLASGPKAKPPAAATATTQQLK